MIYPKPINGRRHFLLFLLLLLLFGGCGGNRNRNIQNPVPNVHMRPLSEAMVIQEKACAGMRKHCVELMDSVVLKRPDKKADYLSNFQLADTLFQNIERIKGTLKLESKLTNNFDEYPLNQLRPLHDSLMNYETQLGHKRCEGADSFIYFSHSPEAINELYGLSPNEARKLMLTKIQGDVYTVLREYFLCELRE